jgi:hypothetical protein
VEQLKAEEEKKKAAEAEKKRQAEKERQAAEKAAREAREKEEAAWQAAQSANTIESFEVYLSKYPNGRFVSEALAFKNELKVSYKIVAVYNSMTVSNPKGGRWIFGRQVGVNESVTVNLNEISNDYVVPWCSKTECCKDSKYNGMSISRHEIEKNMKYRLHITGGLSGGRYWTTGEIILPDGWKVESITGAPGSEKDGAYCKVERNTIVFKSGLNYDGCVCSDCGRAKVDIIIKRVH